MEADVCMTDRQPERENDSEFQEKKKDLGAIDSD